MKRKLKEQNEMNGFNVSLYRCYSACLEKLKYDQTKQITTNPMCTDKTYIYT